MNEFISLPPAHSAGIFGRYRIVPFYLPISAPICWFFFRFSIFFSNILLIQLSVSSFGFIVWNNSELHQAGMTLILLSTDFTILWASLKFISFAIIAGPRWYRAKDLYSPFSIIKEGGVGSIKLNFLIWVQSF